MWYRTAQAMSYNEATQMLMALRSRGYAREQLQSLMDMPMDQMAGYAQQMGAPVSQANFQPQQGYAQQGYQPQNQPQFTPQQTPPGNPRVLPTQYVQAPQGAVVGGNDLFTSKPMLDGQGRPVRDPATGQPLYQPVANPQAMQRYYEQYQQQLARMRSVRPTSRTEWRPVTTPPANPQQTGYFGFSDGTVGTLTWAQAQQMARVAPRDGKVYERVTVPIQSNAAPTPVRR